LFSKFLEVLGGYRWAGRRNLNPSLGLRGALKLMKTIGKALSTGNRGRELS
jgi:hypothetical protein